MRSPLKFSMLFFFYCYAITGFGQDIEKLYLRADSFRAKYESLYQNKILSVQPIKRSNSFWFSQQTESGKAFFLVDTEKEIYQPLFDAVKLGEALKKETGRTDINPQNLSLTQIDLNTTTDTIIFYFDGEEYRCHLGSYEIVKREKRNNSNNRMMQRSRADRDNSARKVISPDRNLEAYISEGNLWIMDLNTGNSKKISDDGSVGEYYSSDIYWSPDSKKIVCCKLRPGGDRKLMLIVSSPSDQLQPKTQTHDYVKPGDALPIRRPVLFDLEKESSSIFDFPGIEQQYMLNRIRWDESSSWFSFHFNRRGHQQYTIYRGDIDGKLQPIVDEKSNSFIYYNNLYEYRFNSSNELLWISERDGWRHIYLYDTNGKLKKQITKGEWVVKSIVHVDEKSRELIIKAVGRDLGEDPYLEKYYRVQLKNGKITALTPENGHHDVRFNYDYTCFSDLCSRVDQPPVLRFRSAIDGSVLVEPDIQPDISRLISGGWMLPQVFHAKGRDKETDIWGMIIRPTHFDHGKKYPVIEYIYAGPHDSHVPKAFSIIHRPSELAELGFIVVMIDGMGTANRSKAFHDVCWKNLKDAGFPDRIAWMKAAAEQHPEMDLTRVGIYGGSAGGQNAMGALLFHSDFYDVAVASCGCHDNRMDKIWWNEQWMGYPIGMEYEESSNVVNAHLLKGKLMLILGELDNNVDPSSTLQVVDKLVKHNKEFEFVMLPNVGHTLGESYGERKRRDFFVKNLLDVEPPNWNKE